MLAEPFTIDDEGYVRLPELPGLGIEVDMEKVKAHGEKVLQAHSTAPATSMHGTGDDRAGCK